MDENGKTILVIELDSQTLQQLETEYIIESELIGLEWSKITVFESDVTKTVHRDDVSDVKKVWQELYDKYSDKNPYGFLGEDGVRINEILKGTNSNNTFEVFERWHDYIRSSVKFPIVAEIDNPNMGNLIKQGSKVRITAIDEWNVTEGILATIIYNTKKFVVPLGYLKALDANSSTGELIEDYKLWIDMRDDLDFEIEM